LTTRFSPPAKAPGSGAARGLAFQMPERGLGQAQDLLGIDTARGRQDQLSRPVMLGHETVEIATGEAAHALGGAEDGAPQRLAGKRLFLQPVEDDVVGRIGGLPDLLQDHATLDLDLGGIEGGVQHDVGDQVHGQRHVLLQDPRVVGRDLARGIGVDVAAHILDLLGDLQARCAARCP
jgi:hypothetical protein